MLKTFSLGGIHPPENKFSAGKNIEVMPIPTQVAIPIAQHIGAPAEAVVAKGDEVKVGTLLAKSGGFVSANIHSSVSGKILKIDDVIDSSGYKRKAIIIKVEGDEWEESIDKSPKLVSDISLSAEDIKTRIAQAGIVGLGGATFPTHVKLAVPTGKTCDYLIINAVECEPYLTADHQLMLEKGEEIMVGISILMKSLNVKTAIVGIENNKKDAIKHMRSVAQKYDGVIIEALKVQYPQGGEKQLIDACIKRQIPSGKLPIEVGAVVQNVGTAFAIYEAVQKNKPLIERVVSVTGKSLSKPSNFLTRVGTPLGELIEKAGGMPSDTGKIVGGGPMMGKALTTTEVPITKGSSGVLLINDTEAKRPEMQPCIKCAKCVGVCPMGLMPYLLAKASGKEIWELVEDEKVMDCIECGSCSYTCPSARPLLDLIRVGKSKVGQIMRSRTK